MSRTAIPLLALALLSACADGSTAPVPAPEGACGGIAKVKGWDVTYASQFVGGGTVGGDSIVLHQTLSGIKLTTAIRDTSMMPSEMIWSRQGSLGGVATLGDTARQGGTTTYRLTGAGAPTMDLSVVVDLSSCAVILYADPSVVATGIWNGATYTGSPGVGAFTSGWVTLPSDGFRFEGWQSAGTKAIPSVSRNASNIFPDTTTYIPGGLGYLFPFEHVYGTAEANWGVRPRW